ncbi:MAG: helix-turn-helix domain-containing protein, partial [Clostridia bacterium]|nr:helix-turn-helix domain-containing protein [Clostridia bacterium]
ENELFVITGAHIQDNLEDILSELIRSSVGKHVAGIVISMGYIKEIPKTVVELADQIGMPLLAIPWKLGLSSFSKTICTAIVEESMERDSDNSTVLQLFSGQRLSSEIQLRLKSRLGFDENATYICIALEQTGSAMTGNESLELRNAIIDLFRRRLQMNRFPSLWSKMDNYTVSIIHSESDPDHLKCALESCIRSAAEAFPGIRIRVGMGSSASGFGEIPQSYYQSMLALKIPFSENVIRFDEIGLYSLLLTAFDEASLGSFHQKLFEPILSYDKYHSSELYKTICAYISCDANLAETSKMMHVHENTVKYRIKKIETLMKTDLKHLENLCTISVGIKAGIITNRHPAESSAGS